MDWTPWPLERIEKRVFEALDANHSYRRDAVMGLPGSFLDQRVFPPLPELARHPWLSTWMANPNHIGCHTLGASEPHFRGTQALEREVVAICAEGLLGAEPDRVDGYVASGGTESNIQALWTFRNALRRRGREPSEMEALVAFLLVFCEGMVNPSLEPRCWRALTSLRMDRCFLLRRVPHRYNE